MNDRHRKSPLVLACGLGTIMMAATIAILDPFNTDNPLFTFYVLNGLALSSFSVAVFVTHRAQLSVHIICWLAWVGIGGLVLNHQISVSPPELHAFLRAAYLITTVHYPLAVCIVRVAKRSRQTLAKP